MKSLFRTFGLLSALFVLTACSFGGKKTAYQPLKASEVDQKSYAVAYESTAQTYQDRVNDSYDIESFINGVDEWYKGQVKLPVEQIRASLLNRMLDHDVYAYYSGVLFAADLQNNFNRLSPECWSQTHPASMTQGIYEAMQGLKAGKVRNDEYVTKGSEQWLQLCVKNVEAQGKKKK
ncbi:hypothetical protein A4G20_02150 [Pasteurellaceae bacterium RH1A]|nr:hypothetical protein A4G20_02150 [Pasteurellaceae bacterium RH1A]